MILNAKIGRFIDFFGEFGRRDTFQERIAPKSLEINIKKLHMKFSALNVDFNGPSLDFLDSRKPAHDGIKERYPCISRYFTVVCQSFVKTVADKQLSMSMLPITTSTTPCLKKTKQICFCQNCVKFPPILIIFSRKMANDPTVCEVHSFSTSLNLRHHLTAVSYTHLTLPTKRIV